MIKEKWKYYNPKFECDEINPMMLKYAPWSGHRFFAYDYIRNMMPHNIIELGSHYGCSSFAFLQAIKDAALKVEFTAIDTWEGDSITKYGEQEDVYSNFENVRNNLYSDILCNIIKDRFENVADKISDKSADLIHIDGSHEYEDVKRDFNIWKSKVKENGVIFFHDIAPEYVEGKLMGSYYFWNELKEEYPYTLEFPFSYGLGILCFSEEQYRFLKYNIDFEYYQKVNNTYAVICADEIRKMHFKLCDQDFYIADLKMQLNIKEEHLIKYSQTVTGKDSYIEELKDRINVLNKNIENSDKNINIRNNYIEKLEEDLSEVKKILEENQTKIEEQRQILEEQDNLNKELEYRIQEKEEQIVNKNSMIENLKIENTKLDILYKKTLEYKIKRMLRK